MGRPMNQRISKARPALEAVSAVRKMDERNRAMPVKPSAESLRMGGERERERGGSDRSTG